MADQKEHLFQYTEFWDQRTGLTFGVREILFSKQSAFQHVQVLETDAFGRLLTLDGLVMVTDRDEFVYHEMIAHPSMCLLREPKRALVIGGGDGGTVREILRHASIEQVDLVEIDGVVIDASREFFPVVASALDDPRLNVHVADGIAFVQNAPEGTYDFVVVDSTDPVGIAEGLFGEAFYRDCARIMTPQGILVSQSESPFDRAFQGSIREAHALLSRLFGQTFTYLAFIPTYPLGMWSFMMASPQLHPLDDYDAAEAARRLAPFAGELQYYNPDVHRGAFALPNFVRRAL